MTGTPPPAQDISAATNVMFGKWLQETRIASGFKDLRQVAAQADIDAKTLAAIEAGKELLSTETADKLGKIYKGTNLPHMCAVHERCRIAAGGKGKTPAYPAL